MTVAGKPGHRGERGPGGTFGRTLGRIAPREREPVSAAIACEGLRAQPAVRRSGTGRGFGSEARWLPSRHDCDLAATVAEDL